jgi:TetR/AcrR family transcriptional regulator, mexJK operon transcriptional repressor
MDSLATLEQALAVWAQETVKNLLHPAYVGLLRLLIAELPRFPSLGARFAQVVPQQGGAFLKTLLENARQQGVIAVTDLEPAIRLLAGSLLTYVLGNGLLATAPPLQIPPPEQIDALVRLALQGMASPQAKEAH